uniref:Mucin-like protein 3 n=1 Tax=Neovison vison TaxID=452646 RepID=A0A8C7BIJ4_NEOVI
MAQPVHCIRSTFGLQCCLLILLASWEAGAIQRFQKTDESPAPDHLIPSTSGLVYNTPSDHTSLHSGHSLLDISKSIETHKLKRHCNTTHNFKPIYKPTGNSQNSTSDHIVHPTSGKNPSNQGKDPNVQNVRSLNITDSTNTHKGLSGTKDPIPAPRNKTACHKPNIQKMGTGNQHKTVTPSRNINVTLNSKSTASHKIISPVHNLVSPESNEIPNSSSGQRKTTTKVSSESKKIPERSKRAEDHKTSPSSRTTVPAGKTEMKTTEPINRSTSATENNTPVLATLREGGHRTTSAHIHITRLLENSLEHGRGDRAEKNTLANGKTTKAPETSMEDAGKTTGAPEETKDHAEKITQANERITKTPAKSTKRDQTVNNTSPGSNKKDITHEVPIGSFTRTTSHMELSFTISETPGNQSHPYQNKDGSHRGLHTGGMSKNDSFPAWAIVIVVLVAVILFLMFLGLIFLVSYMTKTRHARIQNKEDGDPEDDGGPNSYPVYLMEQQTLGTGQIASPQ